jgi:hypothetical protein
MERYWWGLHQELLGMGYAAMPFGQVSKNEDSRVLSY